MQLLIALIFGTIWNALRGRVLLSCLAVIGVLGFILKDEFKRYATERVATATVIGFEWKCAVVDKATRRAGPPQVSQVPCDEIGDGFYKALPNRVLAQNRGKRAKLAYVTQEGERIEMSVPFHSVRLPKDAKVGDPILVAYDPAHPAKMLNRPANGSSLLFGVAGIFAFFYFLAKGGLEEYMRREQKRRDAGARVVHTALRGLQDLLGPGRTTGKHDNGSLGDQTARMAHGFRKVLEQASENLNTHTPTSTAKEKPARKLTTPWSSPREAMPLRAPLPEKPAAASYSRAATAGRPVETSNYKRKPAVQRNSRWF